MGSLMIGEAKKRVSAEIDSYRDEMVDAMKKMIAVKAISPESGGLGEARRADMLKKLLEMMGNKVSRYDYKDDSGATRSNLIVTYGNATRTIWILSHMDTVAEGDRSLWHHDPFDAYEKSGRLYGRGTSDNGQGVISSIFALKALEHTNVRTNYRVGIALVADEEVGSKYGVRALLKEGIFKRNDMIVVPDSGNSDGTDIEIAEKGILWLKFTVKGKQVHASTPGEGLNAYRVATNLLVELDSMLHKKYDYKDPLFEPNVSTFEMTKHEKNVDSVNIVPGVDTFYLDCRVLPKYKLDRIIADINKVTRKYEKKGAKIRVQVYNREDPAKPTSSSSEIARIIEKAVLAVKGKKGRFVGIGGGTVAKYFRDLGIPAVVWATLPDNAHQPNEYLVIDDMVSDAKVFAMLFL
ncbi:MAG: M20 family metallo-hydrolase [Candidatus Marsarchaeota archaeon]|nr:M20 family metallo-hydrolase [Candidatus Marsarchaeota archaeon]MCL5419119.1 M20 family metallo-hydrolase [Candidatus Marsarchaeota archaeon]